MAKACAGDNILQQDLATVIINQSRITILDKDFKRGCDLTEREKMYYCCVSQEHASKLNLCLKDCVNKSTWVLKSAKGSSAVMCSSHRFTMT